MTLGELLSELRENILHDRSDQIAGDTDQLWSDATLVRYIDEAQRRLARLGFVIVDARTDEVCRLTTVPGQQEYDLHPSVLGVISARPVGDNKDLMRINHSQVGGFILPGSPLISGEHIPAMNPGKAWAFQTDETLAANDEGSVGVVTMTIHPVPDEAQTIALRVVREPIHRLDVAFPDTAPEVPEQHHLEMLDWAAHLALRIVDLDAGSPRRAEEFRRSFDLTVAYARKTMLRKLQRPLTWGFGAGGFTWER